MDVFKFHYPDDGPLKSIVKLEGPNGVTFELGSGFLPKGTRMPALGESAHPRHEVTIILDGMLETRSGGRTCVLRAGDVVSIPAGQSQASQVLDDTHLVWCFITTEETAN
ncbi:cupin domain-containing protein [Niveispirillum sp. KHB5.9]|uniref:cupin domain-containing protein n=1 Tax=Niveispirillum sp. KHB5.9 TaxID=3400269 RepID=UPI003A869C32